jgi:hypothetical protein
MVLALVLTFFCSIATRDTPAEQQAQKQQDRQEWWREQGSALFAAEDGHQYLVVSTSNGNGVAVTHAAGCEACKKEKAKEGFENAR